MASSTVTIATRTGYSSNVRCLLSLRPMSRLGVWERVRVLNVQNGTRVTCFERNNHEHRSRGIGPAVCGTPLPILGKVWDRMWDKSVNSPINRGNDNGLISVGCRFESCRAHTVSYGYLR